MSTLNETQIAILRWMNDGPVERGIANHFATLGPGLNPTAPNGCVITANAPAKLSLEDANELQGTPYIYSYRFQHLGPQSLPQWFITDAGRAFIDSYDHAR